MNDKELKEESLKIYYQYLENAANGIIEAMDEVEDYDLDIAFRACVETAMEKIASGNMTMAVSTSTAFAIAVRDYIQMRLESRRNKK